MNYGQSVGRNNYAGQAVGANASTYDQANAMQQKMAADIGPVPNRQSEQMFHEIGQRFMRLGDLISRLELLTDRACGCVPADPKVNAMGRDAPNTLTDKISITIPMLDEANSRLMGAVERLESFV